MHFVLSLGDKGSSKGVVLKIEAKFRTFGPPKIREERVRCLRKKIKLSIRPNLRYTFDGLRGLVKQRFSKKCSAAKLKVFDICRANCSSSGSTVVQKPIRRRRAINNNNSEDDDDNDNNNNNNNNKNNNNNSFLASVFSPLAFYTIGQNNNNNNNHPLEFFFRWFKK